MSASLRQRVTGLVVNQHPSIHRADYERLKAILHNSIRSGPASQNREDHPDFRSWLAGRIGWVAMVQPERGRRLRAAFDQIDWSR